MYTHVLDVSIELEVAERDHAGTQFDERAVACGDERDVAPRRNAPTSRPHALRHSQEPIQPRSSRDENDVTRLRRTCRLARTETFDGHDNAASATIYAASWAVLWTDTRWMRPLNGYLMLRGSKVPAPM